MHFKKMLDEGSHPSHIGRNPAYYEMLKWGNEVERDGELPGLWRRNIKENMEFFDANKDRIISAHDMKCDARAAIVVGASPNVRENLGVLKTVDRGLFTIAATNSSAGLLVENGIIPDYVFYIDGQQYDWTLDIGEDKLGIPMVVSPFAGSDVVKRWKSDFIVLPFNLSEEDLAIEVQSRFGEPIGQAGNAFNCAVATFVQCTEIPLFLFVGNELSFKEKYYADCESRNDDAMYFFATDVNGDEVRTQIPLWQYKLWIDNLMEELSGAGYFFFNCSEGIVGVGTSGEVMPYVTPAPLKDALEQCLSAFEFEDQDDMEKSKQVYDMLYENGMYFPKNGAGNWKQLYDKMEAGESAKFTKALDVGCGTGTGVYQMVTHGYDVYGCDIADNAEAWKAFGIGDRFRVAPAHEMPYGDGEFDFVLCSDVMEHIPKGMVDASLREILRVCDGKFWFAIANRLDSPPEGLPHTHLTIAPLPYWIGKMEDVGYKIIWANEDEHHCSIICERGE